MKRLALCILAAMMMLGGCAASREDPFRVDTVVRIPADPTDAPTEEPTETPTEEPTEDPTEAPTEPEPTAAKKATASSQSSTSGKSGSSSKSSSSSSKKQSSSKKEPAATQPPKVTEPPTEPSTEPPTEPPTAPPTEPPVDPYSYSVGGLEYAILNELNAYRTEADLPELSISGLLSGIAAVRAQEVCMSWSHTRPDGRGFTSAMSDYGYGYGAASELLVYVSGSGDGAAIAARWMASDSGSEDILSDSFTEAGIGVYHYDGMSYVACLLVG